jgi:hypothetical protein
MICQGRGGDWQVIPISGLDDPPFMATSRTSQHGAVISYQHRSPSLANHSALRRGVPPVVQATHEARPESRTERNHRLSPAGPMPSPPSQPNGCPEIEAQQLPQPPSFGTITARTTRDPAGSRSAPAATHLLRAIHRLRTHGTAHRILTSTCQRTQRSLRSLRCPSSPSGSQRPSEHPPLHRENTFRHPMGELRPIGYIGTGTNHRADWHLIGVAYCLLGRRFPLALLPRPQR